MEKSIWENAYLSAAERAIREKPSGMVCFNIRGPCNLNCSYCLDRGHRHDVTTDELKAALSEASLVFKRYLKSPGCTIQGGELSFYTKEQQQLIVDWMRSTPVSWCFFTNGYDLSSPIVDCATYISVSLHQRTEERLLQLNSRLLLLRKPYEIILVAPDIEEYKRLGYLVAAYPEIPTRIFFNCYTMRELRKQPQTKFSSLLGEIHLQAEWLIRDSERFYSPICMPGVEVLDRTYSLCGHFPDITRPLKEFSGYNKNYKDICNYFCPELMSRVLSVYPKYLPKGFKW